MFKISDFENQPRGLFLLSLAVEQPAEPFDADLRAGLKSSRLAETWLATACAGDS